MSVHRAIRFTGLASILTFALSFTSVIVVSRLLSPEEIGLFSVAVSMIAYTHILRDFGVGQYLVQLKELTREHVRASFTVMLLISWGIALGLLILRGPLATFYEHDAISSLLTALSVNFVILPFGSAILSILKREMQFGKISLVHIANSVVQVGVTIGTAMAGESYMSMAWGSIAGNVTNVIVLSLLRPDLALLLPTTKGISSVLSFGTKSSAGSLVSELGNTGPDLIFGKTLGFEAVAMFSRASSLNHMVLSKVTQIVGQVFFPAFAQGIREGRSPSSMYCSSMSLLTGITVPLLVVLAFLSEPLILVLFGSQWQAAASLASILCLQQLIRAPVFFASRALIANGHAGLVLRVQIINQVFALAILSLSIWLQLHEVVYLLTIARVLEFMTFTGALSVTYGLKRSTLLSAVFQSYKLLPITLAGPVLLWSILHLTKFEMPLPIYVCVAGGLSAIGYIMSLRYLNHPVRAELVRIAPPISHLLGKISKSP